MPRGSTQTPLGNGEIEPGPPTSSQVVGLTVEVIKSIRESKSGCAPPPCRSRRRRGRARQSACRARSSLISEADCNEAVLAPAKAWAWTIWPSKASRCFGSVVRRAKSNAGANSPASRNARTAVPALAVAMRGPRRPSATLSNEPDHRPAQPIRARESRDHHGFSFRCWGDSQIIAQGGNATAIPPARISP